MKEVAYTYKAASFPPDNAKSRASQLMRLADSLEIRRDPIYTRRGVGRDRVQESTEQSGAKFLLPSKSSDLREAVLS